MKATHKWLIGILSTVVALAVLLHFFDWNLLRGFVERRVSHATGRTFTIAGDLDVELSWHPRVIVNEVTLSNVEWSSEPLMVRLQHVEITLDIPSLFTRHIKIPLLQLTAPEIVLEKNEKGVGNWVFTNDSSKSSRTVSLQQVDIDRGKLVYRSVIEQADIKVEVFAEPDTNASTHRLHVQANGLYHDLDTEISGDIGAITSVADLDGAYPIQLSGHVGKMHASAEGVISNPVHFGGINIDFEVSGGSLAEVFPLVGVPLPPTPAYAVSGHLVQQGDTWNVEQFEGKVGNSDVSGQASLDRSHLPQFIQAKIQSNSLDLKDLSGTVGGRTDQGEKIVRGGDKVLPDEPYDLEKLYSANVDVEFKGKHIQTQRLPIDNMQAHLKINAGKVVLDPLNFGVASGDIDALINMNVTNAPTETNADIKFKNIRFDQLFPELRMAKANAGIIGGRAKLASKGNSIAKMLGSANGQVALMMNGGSVSKLALRLSNLDVANSIVALLGGDKSVPVRCMVADLKADDGNMTVTTMVLDTDKAALKGEGNINFKDETLNLKLIAAPKDMSLIALRGPIDVTGTFKNPKPVPELKKAGGRIALATILGSVAGPLAFIPLVDFGGGDDSDCAALLRQADANSKQQPVKH